MVTAVAAGFGPHAPARLAGEGFERLGCDARSSPIESTLGPLCVSAGLVADGLQLGHALFEHRIGDVGDSIFDRIHQTYKLRGIDKTR